MEYISSTSIYTRYSRRMYRCTLTALSPTHPLSFRFSGSSWSTAAALEQAHTLGSLPHTHWRGYYYCCAQLLIIMEYSSSTTRICFGDRCWGNKIFKVLLLMYTRLVKLPGTEYPLRVTAVKLLTPEPAAYLLSFFCSWTHQGIRLSQDEGQGEHTQRTHRVYVFRTSFFLLLLLLYVHTAACTVVYYLSLDWEGAENRYSTVVLLHDRPSCVCTGRQADLMLSVYIQIKKTIKIESCQTILRFLSHKRRVLDVATSPRLRP